MNKRKILVIVRASSLLLKVFLEDQFDLKVEVTYTYFDKTDMVMRMKFSF